MTQLIKKTITSRTVKNNSMSLRFKSKTLKSRAKSVPLLNALNCNRLLKCFALLVLYTVCFDWIKGVGETRSLLYSPIILTWVHWRYRMESVTVVDPGFKRADCRSEEWMSAQRINAYGLKLSAHRPTRNRRYASDHRFQLVIVGVASAGGRTFPTPVGVSWWQSVARRWLLAF